ncbi:MAG: MotA/TolQ/ExbB proton channel family protein, partial [Pseudomonadota bacterium]
MAPIILCSVIALTIIAERFWSLRVSRIAPANLAVQVSNLYKQNALTIESLEKLRQNSPLGRILANGLKNINHEREIMKESVEETGRQVAIELERYLNTLGTIASIT